MRILTTFAAGLLALGGATLASAQEAASEDTEIAAPEEAYEVGETLPEKERFAFLDPRSYAELPERVGKLYAYKDGWAYLIDPATRLVQDVYTVIRDRGVR